MTANDQTPAKVQQWEYKVILRPDPFHFGPSPSNQNIEAALNQAGLDGWELCGTWSQPHESGGFTGTCFLKRPKR